MIRLVISIVSFSFFFSVYALGPNDNLTEAFRNGGSFKLSPGVYRQGVSMKNLPTSASNPLIIEAEIPGTVSFSGTEVLSDLSWELYDDTKGIYRTREPLSQDIWQLFVQGKMMVNARWPNAEHPFEKGIESTWWKRPLTWCKALKEGSGFEQIGEQKFRGWLTNNGLCNMRDSGIDFNDKIAVLNVNSMTTYAGKIKNWNAELESFEYDIDTTISNTFGDKQVGLIHKNRGHAYFYFENHLDFLDAPGEWFYDAQGSKHLYLIPENGSSPEGLTLEGKVRSFAFDFEDSDNIEISGIHFFATTVSLVDCFNCKVENSHFEYASYSRRMLGDLREIPHTKMSMNKIGGDLKDNPENLPRTNNRFLNNVVTKTDGMGLEMTKGVYDSIYNNEFTLIDISGAIGGSQCIDYRQGYRTYFIRNTIYGCGSSAATKGSKRPVNLFNDMSHWGYLQDDGTGFQIAAGGQEGSITMYNWIHDVPKSGMRFDGSEEFIQSDDSVKLIEGSFARNVVWNNTLGYMVKGDLHRVYNNVAFSNEASGAKILMGQTHGNSNQRTEVKNNIMEDMTGMRSGDYLSAPVPGDETNNWVGTIGNHVIERVLRDPQNHDFRPIDPEQNERGLEVVDQGIAHLPGVTSLKGYPYPSFTEEHSIGTPDIGAYELGADEYWIPGRMGETPSNPVPPHGSVTAKTDLDLMWLKPYKSDENTICKVDFSNEEGKLVEIASQTTNIVFNKQLSNGKKLDPSKIYQWRVRCVVEGEEKISPIWEFKPAALDYVECTEKLSHVDYFSTPMGPEDYDDPTWNPSGKNFKGHVQLEDNHLVILPHLLYQKNHPEAVGAIPEGETAYDYNLLKTNVNLKIRPFPYLKFDYYAKNRKDSITFFFKLSPKEVGKKSSDGFKEITVPPAQKEYKTILVNLEDHIANIDEKVEENWEYLEQIRILVNPTTEWDSIQDGELHIDNFFVGYEAIKNEMDSLQFVSQAQSLELEKGEKRILSMQDFRFTGFVEDKQWDMGPCQEVRDDWELVVDEQGAMEGFAVFGTNIIALDGQKSLVNVPVKIKKGESFSQSFPMQIALKEIDLPVKIPKEKNIKKDAWLGELFFKEFKVYSGNGKLLYMQKKQGLGEVMKTLPTGTYWLKGITDEGKTLTQEFVVP